MKLVKQMDGAVQSAVDAVAFAAMRTFGVRKSFVRYALGLCLVGHAVLTWMRRSDWKWAAVAALWLLVSELARRSDEKAEERGMLSATDQSWLPMKAFWFGCLVVDLVRVNGLNISLDCLLLVHEYLRNTPSEPPASKKTVLKHAEAST